MHEDDRDGIDAVAACVVDRAPDGIEIGRTLDRAVGAHALVDLDDALVELLGQDDLLGEDIGPRLVGDAQRIAKSPGDQQQHAVALALEQRVGGDGRPHLDLADAAGRHGFASRDTEQFADALDGGIAIGFGIFRKQFQRTQRAVGIAADDVGKGAAAVDPEIPSAGHVKILQSSIPVALHPCGKARALSRAIEPARESGLD